MLEALTNERLPKRFANKGSQVWFAMYEEVCITAIVTSQLSEEYELSEESAIGRMSSRKNISYWKNAPRRENKLSAE